MIPILVIYENHLVDGAPSQSPPPIHGDSLVVVDYEVALINVVQKETLVQGDLFDFVLADE